MVTNPNSPRIVLKYTYVHVSHASATLLSVIWSILMGAVITSQYGAIHTVWVAISRDRVPYLMLKALGIAPNQVPTLYSRPAAKHFEAYMCYNQLCVR